MRANDSPEFFDRSAIADEIGVLELRVGRRLQYRNSHSKREKWLSALWDATFIPTFNKPVTVAVVAVSHVNDEGTATLAETIGVVSSDEHVFSKVLDHDPVLHLLERIPVSHPPDFRQCRDGHGYCVQVTTTALDVRLIFDNPELGELRQLEVACLTAARTLSQASGDSTLIENVRIWEEYVKDRA